MFFRKWSLALCQLYFGLVRCQGFVLQLYRQTMLRLALGSKLPAKQRLGGLLTIEASGQANYELPDGLFLAYLMQVLPDMFVVFEGAQGMG
jgi:hypothetical protein